jgi:hypothetical protein
MAHKRSLALITFAALLLRRRQMLNPLKGSFCGRPVCSRLEAAPRTD